MSDLSDFKSIKRASAVIVFTFVTKPFLFYLDCFYSNIHSFPEKFFIDCSYKEEITLTLLKLRINSGVHISRAH